MSEFTGVYLRGLQLGIAKRAGVGRAAGVLGALLGTVALGKQHGQRIMDQMPKHVGIGAGLGAVTGGTLGVLQDSDVAKLDPNALAKMTPDERAIAQDVHSSQRSSERARRLVRGALKGGLGGSALGALTATGQGMYEGIQAEGLNLNLLKPQNQ
jgi:hypothetical protein